MFVVSRIGITPISCRLHSSGCFDASGRNVRCACQLPCLFALRCTWTCVCLKSLHCVERWLVVCLSVVERQHSTPQVPWLHQQQPRVLRRKRDCTLPSSSQLPRVHLRRRCVHQRRKDCTQAFLLATSASTSEEEGQALLLTMSACTSEEGQALLLTMSASTSEEEGQALLFYNVGKYLGGAHPNPLARISKVESSPMSTKKILVDHERGQNNDNSKFVTVNKWQKKDICKAWNNSRRLRSLVSATARTSL